MGIPYSFRNSMFEGADMHGRDTTCLFWGPPVVCLMRRPGRHETGTDPMFRSLGSIPSARRARVREASWRPVVPPKFSRAATPMPRRRLLEPAEPLPGRRRRHVPASVIRRRRRVPTGRLKQVEGASPPPPPTSLCPAPAKAPSGKVEVRVSQGGGFEHRST